MEGDYSEWDKRIFCCNLTDLIFFLNHYTITLNDKYMWMERALRLLLK